MSQRVSHLLTFSLLSLLGSTGRTWIKSVRPRNHPWVTGLAVIPDLSRTRAGPSLPRTVALDSPYYCHRLRRFQYGYLKRSLPNSASSLFPSSRLKMSTETAGTATVACLVPGRPTWQQTMLRIKDPKLSLPFYTDLLGMTLIDQFDFPQYQFSLYFLTTLPDGETYAIQPGTQEAHDYLWSMEGVALELTHNHGTESADSNVIYHPGNQDNDGFGHIAVNVNNVYATAERLEKAQCTFKKKPDEGRMKGIAFVYDPDGYWVELVPRGEKACSEFKNECNFSQTMLRIKDPAKSLAFYQSFGMQILAERHFDNFSLYFLGSSNVPDVGVKDLFQPVLELTHNHGTEKDPNFMHFNGNEEGRQGFGHIGFLVDDVYAACDTIRTMGYGFRKEPDGGSMKGLAFAYDPDGYSVEIIKRGGIDFGDIKK